MIPALPAIALTVGKSVFGGKAVATLAAGLFAVALLGIGFAYWQGRSDGRELEQARIAAAVAAERKRMETVQAGALAEAGKNVARLIQERDAWAERAIELQEEASRDPHANRPAMTKEGAARMNRIR